MLSSWGNSQPESDDNLITTVSELWPKVGDGVNPRRSSATASQRRDSKCRLSETEQRSPQTIALLSCLSLTVREGREAVTPRTDGSALLTGS